MFPFEPDAYSRALSKYAAYAIEFKTPVGNFHQQAQKMEGILVLDEGNGNFSLYMTYQTLASFGTDQGLRNKELIKNFQSTVSIGTDIKIKIIQNKVKNSLEIVAFTLFLVLVSILAFGEIPLMPLLLLPLTPLPLLFQNLQKKRLEKIAVDFLNEVTSKS